MTISRVLAQVLQLRSAKWSYFSPENVMELIAYLGSILLVMDFSKCQEYKGIRTVSATDIKLLRSQIIKQCSMRRFYHI